jgi:hypothetical protein
MKKKPHEPLQETSSWVAIGICFLYSPLSTTSRQKGTHTTLYASHFVHYFYIFIYVYMYIQRRHALSNSWRKKNRPQNAAETLEFLTTAAVTRIFLNLPSFNKSTPCCRVREKMLVAQVARNSLLFMHLGHLSPYSPEPTICSHLRKLIRLQTPSNLLMIHFNIILPCLSVPQVVTFLL